MALKRLSKTFYKVSFIISIVYVALIALGMIIFGASLGAALNGDVTLTDPAGNAYDREVLVAAIVIYEVIFAFTLAFAIVNLVVSKKAFNKPSKKLHILGIIFGVLSGVEFSTAAGILGLIALSREPKEEVIDVEAKDK